MDPRLIILAVAFAFLLLALLAFIVSAIRSARARRVEAPEEDVAEWPALPAAPDRAVDTSLEGLEVEVPPDSPSAALLTPLRVGNWQPPESPAPVESLPEVALAGRIASYAPAPAVPEPEFSVEAYPSWQVAPEATGLTVPAPEAAPAQPAPAAAPAAAPAQPAAAPAQPAPGAAPAQPAPPAPAAAPPQPAPESRVIVVPEVIPSSGLSTPSPAATIPTPVPAQAAAGTTVPPIEVSAVPGEPDDFSAEIAALLPPEKPAIAPSVPLTPSPASAAPVMPAIPTAHEMGLTAVEPVTASTAAPAPAAPQQHEPPAASPMEPVAGASEDVERPEPVVPPVVKPEAIPSAPVPQPAATPIVSAPKVEPAGLDVPQPSAWEPPSVTAEPSWIEEESTPVTAAPAAAAPSAIPPSPPADTGRTAPGTVPSEAAEVSGVSGGADGVFWESVFREQQQLSSIVDSSRSSEEERSPRPPAVVHAETPQSAPPSAPAAVGSVRARPKAVVRTLASDATGTGAARPGLRRSVMTAAPSLAAASRDEVGEMVMVAPVEMWFGDSRVGVKAGTKTYDQFRKYANVLLGDLKAPSVRSR